MKHQYKLKRQKPDVRDYSAKLLNLAPIKLPKSMDIRMNCPGIYDQLSLGSCTANAGVAARVMLNNLKINLSRLFLYYNERMIEGTTSQDAGANMRDIGKAIATYGICPEIDCPYVISNFSIAPSITANTNAIPYKIKGYYALNSMDQIKQVIALRQQPVMIGMDVFTSFESSQVAKTGKIPLPKKGEQLLGSHAVLIVGYVDPYFFGLLGGYFIVRNSWGNSWGDKGYFYLPYTYFTKGYAFDFWALD